LFNGYGSSSGCPLMGDNLTPAVSSWSEILGSSVRPFLIELQHLLLLAVLLIFSIGFHSVGSCVLALRFCSLLRALAGYNVQSSFNVLC
jgi:hypothetical protein